MRVARRRRRPHRDRPQRLAAVHRRRRLGRVEHPPVAHGERSARGDRRAARAALLQHRHRELRLAAVQPQERRSDAARCSSSTPAGCGRRCARASARSGAISTRSRSPRSRACTDRFEEGELVKVVPVEQFGYRTITVDRPLRARWEFGPTTWDGVAERQGAREARRGHARGRRREPRGDRAPDLPGGGRLPRRSSRRSWPRAASRSPGHRCSRRSRRAAWSATRRPSPCSTAKGGRSPTRSCATPRTCPLTEDVDEYLAREVHPACTGRLGG